MGSEAGGLHQCLTDLCRVEDTGDYQKALQAANKLIRRYPKECYAFKCKAIALIQLGQYDDALAVITKTPPAQLGDCTFEKGYVLYRLGKIDEALEALSASTETDFRSQELRAQIYYKLEKFQEAHDIYLNLIKNHTDMYDEERQANFLAVQTQLETMGSAQEISGQWDTYEQLYNGACHLIEKREFKKALESLEKALVQCHDNLESEGLTDEEIEEECAIINVQKAYVLLKLGKDKESLELFKRVQETKPSDVSVNATLTNNICGATSDLNLAEARKKFKTALQLDQSKLSRRQRHTLMLNNALVLLLSNQREPCRRALTELVGKFGKTRDSRLIESALLVKLNDVDKAAEVLEGDDLEMQLTRAHVLINSGRVEQALKVLQSLPAKDKNQLGVSGLITSCLVALDRKADAIKELDATLTKVKDVSVKRTLLDEAAKLETARGNAANAVKYLEQLASVSPDDVTVKCRLIRAYSETDPAKAEQLSAKVFPSDGSTSLNVDELEESDWILYGEKYRQKKDAKMELDDTEIITRKLKNRKRKRKVILPKNYDPNVPPDPERWLPKQERAAYKKKHKKNRDRDIGRGTQGSASANPNVEFMTASPNSPRPVASVAQEGPRQLRPKPQQKAKKKKAKF